MTENNAESPRRDPLALSFEAHRRLLLLRLRLHASSTRRKNAESIERPHVRSTRQRMLRGHLRPQRANSTGS